MDDAETGIATTRLMPSDLTRRRFTVSIAAAAAGTIGGASLGRAPATDNPSTDVVAHPTVLKSSERRTVLDFIPPSLHAGIEDGTVAADLTQYLVRAAAYAKQPRTRLVFPSGIYPYSVSPNWAGDHVRVQAEGEVRLRCTGSGDAVILDSGANTTVSVPGKTDMRFGPFIVEGNAAGGHGGFLRAIHHSEIDLNVRGCGTGKAALYMQFGVCTVAKLVVSINQGPWYGGGVPAYGILLEARPLNGNSTLEPVSYCDFPRPIIEGVGRGVDFTGALGCHIDRGTIEGCTVAGITLGATSTANSVQGVDLEANANYDVLDAGRSNRLVFLDSQGLNASGTPNRGLIIGATAADSIIVAGQYNQISIAEGAQRTKLSNAPDANRYGNGTFTNLGSDTSGLFRDVKTGTWRLAGANKSILVLKGTKYTYTNTTPVTQMLGVSGGTSVALFFLYNGVADGIGATNGLFAVPPGQGMIITYANGGAPTVSVYAGQ